MEKASPQGEKSTHIWFDIEELTSITIYRNANQKGIAFVQILIISVTLIVMAVPEGLPLAVTLALAFTTKRMIYGKLLIWVLESCRTMPTLWWYALTRPVS